MSKLSFTSLLSLLALIGAVFPSVVGATAPSQTKPYLQSYVPCGTDDTMKKVQKKDADGKPIPNQFVMEPATQKITENGVERIIPGDGVVDNPCGFTDIIELARRIIMGWIMAGVTFATLGFTYAGYLYITAMGSEEKVSHAHSIFTKTIWGFVFMLSAWLIAYTLESVFLSEKVRCKYSFLTTEADKKAMNCAKYP